MNKSRKLNTEIQIDRKGCLFLSRPSEVFTDAADVEKFLREVTGWDGDVRVQNFGSEICVDYRDESRKGRVNMIMIQWKNQVEWKLVFAPGFGTGLEVGTALLEFLRNKFFGFGF